MIEVLSQMGTAAEGVIVAAAERARRFDRRGSDPFTAILTEMRAGVEECRRERRRWSATGEGDPRLVSVYPPHEGVAKLIWPEIRLGNGPGAGRAAITSDRRDVAGRYE